MDILKSSQYYLVLSQYYFHNIFLQKSCRFSLQILTKFEAAKTGSGVGSLRLTAVCPTPRLPDSPAPKNPTIFIFRADICLFFCLFIFQNSILHIFLIFIIIIRCSRMFHVPCCMFLILMTAHLVTRNHLSCSQLFA